MTNKLFNFATLLLITLVIIGVATGFIISNQNRIGATQKVSTELKETKLVDFVQIV